MRRKHKIKFKISGEKFTIILNGEEVKNALGELYGGLIKSAENKDAGIAAINMFLRLFGEEITEKILLSCEKEPEKTMRKIKRIIKRKLLTIAAGQKRFENAFRFNATYKNVTEAAAVLKNTTIPEAARVNMTLFLLLERFSYFRACFLPMSERINLLKRIFDGLSGGSDENDKKSTDGNSNSPRALSLEKDSGLIYGAFLQSFGIDLHNDELAWRDFCTLLSCIPESTVLFNIMKIRTMEIPKNISSEDAEKLYALKRKYSLEKNNFNSELEILFNKFKE